MKRFVSVLKKDPISRIRSLYRNEHNHDLERLEKQLGFSEREIDEVKDIFRYFDKDKNKYLDHEECQCLFKHQVGCNLDNCNFKKVFDKMDLNKDGYISFPEYLRHLAARKRKLPLNYELQEIFELFDRNNDGRLNLDDFRHALLYMGEDAGRADLKALYVHYDDDRDGLITKYEFQDIIRERFSR